MKFFNLFKRKKTCVSDSTHSAGTVINQSVKKESSTNFSKPRSIAPTASNTLPQARSKSQAKRLSTQTGRKIVYDPPSTIQPQNQSDDDGFLTGVAVGVVLDEVIREAFDNPKPPGFNYSENGGSFGGGGASEKWDDGSSDSGSSSDSSDSSSYGSSDD